MDIETFPKNYDSFKVFLFKKVERISLALYMASNHLSDSISLKGNLRNLADILIKDIILFNAGHSTVVASEKLSHGFLEIKTLLSLSAGSNLINQNNVQILLDEINRISREIENHKDSFIGDSEFKKSFFVVESRQKLPEAELSNKVDKIDKGHKRQEAVVSEKKVYIGQTPNLELNSRNEEIMKIIKDNNKVTIKDISSQIRNCSEKTIQRELIKMVSLNLIKKEGERRWSTYSVI
jgi:hypothetical protein